MKFVQRFTTSSSLSSSSSSASLTTTRTRSSITTTIIVLLTAAVVFAVAEAAAVSVESSSSSSTVVQEEAGDNKQAILNSVATTIYDKNACEPGPHNVPNPSPEPDAQAPDLFYFKIPTTATTVNVNNVNDVNVLNDDDNNDGLIIFEVNRTWAPIGVDRFYSLAKDNYYDCAAFFRVVPNFIVQWGIASSPQETAKWNTNIPDEGQDNEDEDNEYNESEDITTATRTSRIISISNTVGTVSFASAGPGTRTTQIFVNTADNSRLDDMGFAPFAKVVKGMDILINNKMYVPSPVPNQATYEDEGNAWILQEYPDIEIIKGLPQTTKTETETETEITKVTLTLTDDAVVAITDDDNDTNDDNSSSSTSTSAAVCSTNSINNYGKMMTTLAIRAVAIAILSSFVVVTLL